MNRIQQLREENRKETQTLRLIQNELAEIVEALHNQPYKTHTLEGESCTLCTKEMIWQLIKSQAKVELQFIKDEKKELQEV